VVQVIELRSKTEALRLFYFYPGYF
jgi:hypothetical protein